LGAGFGGLEMATMLSQALGGDVEVTLIEKNDSFVFGYSKLDVMFGRTTLDAVRLPYREIAKPGVCFLRQTVTAIDLDARSVDHRRWCLRG
jgi:sulfide:quinone oxidoreductase